LGQSIYQSVLSIQPERMEETNWSCWYWVIYRRRSCLWW